MRSSEISKEIRRSSFDPDTDEFFELTRSDHVEEKLNRSNGTPATQACAFRGPPNNWLLDEDEQSNANDEISDPIAAAEALEELYDVNIGEIARLKEMLTGVHESSPAAEEAHTAATAKNTVSQVREGPNLNNDEASPPELAIKSESSSICIKVDPLQQKSSNIVTTKQGAAAKQGNMSATDRLINKKYEYEQRREQMRRAKQEAEDAEMQIKPQINKHSERLLSGQTRKSIAQRTQEQAMLKKERAEKLKVELAAKESSEIRQRPQINDRSKKLTRDICDMQQWEQEKIAKREGRQNMKALEQDLECSFAPTLNKRTEKLTASRNRPRSASLGPRGQQNHSNIKIEDRLLQHAELYREKREIAKERKHNEDRKQATPQVAPHSANLPRNGDVASRLYGIAEAQRTKQAQIERRARVLVEHNIDPETGNELFRPKINASSKVMVRRRRGANERVEDSLTAHGESYQRRQQDRKIREDRAARERTNIKINKQSEKIVGYLEQRMQESSIERLAKPIGQRVKKSTIESVPQYSFKPTKYTPNSDMVLSTNHGTPIAAYDPNNKNVTNNLEFAPPNMPHSSKASKDRDVEQGCSGLVDNLRTLQPPAKAKSNNIRHGPSIAERSAIWERKRAAKEHSLAIERDKAIAAECSFAPKVSAQSNRVALRANVGRGSMWERNTEWSKRRADKLEAERKFRDMEELAECTFVPNSESYTRIRSGKASELATQLDGSEFVEEIEVPSATEIRELLMQKLPASASDTDDVGSGAPKNISRAASYMVQNDVYENDPIGCSRVTGKSIETSGEMLVETPPPAISLKSSLPPGWQRIAMNDGSEYFWNKDDGLTQWEHPSLTVSIEHFRVPPQPPADTLSKKSSDQYQRIKIRFDGGGEVVRKEAEPKTVLPSNEWLALVERGVGAAR